MLYRDRQAHYVFLRFWKSEEARRAALEDPEVLRCLSRLALEIEIIRIHERLHEVSLG